MPVALKRTAFFTDKTESRHVAANRLCGVAYCTFLVAMFFLSC